QSMINPDPMSASRNSARHRSFGEVVFWQSTPIGIEGRSEFAHFRITVFDDGILRVQASLHDSFEPNPYSVVAHSAKPHFQLTESKTQLALTTSKLHLELDLKSFQLAFFNPDGKLLNADDLLAISW